MIWIGTSGWVYPHWVDRFYPPDLPMRDWLAYYAQYFPTVEINRSFYRLPTREQFHAWAGQTSAYPGFFFAVKASRYITHMKKLKDPQEAIDRLITSAQGLGDKLGPFLYQLPPHWHANPNRLEQFIALLPRQYQAAFEFRDPSWFEPETFKVLSNILDVAGCALVIAIGDTHLMPTNVASAASIGSFSYFRFHHGAYSIGLTEDELVYWSKQIGGGNARLEGEKRDLYVYFNNDPYGYAIKDAFRLRELLGITARSNSF